MTVWAADFSAAQLSAADLLGAGYHGACRYITGAGKQISAAELHDLTTTPGMALALVNETFGQAASRGYNQGRMEAEAAFTRADALGWPADRPIYFVGEDPTQVPAAQWLLIEDYFRGVLTVVPPSRIGDYGSAIQIDHMMGLGLCAYGWAVETWRGSPAGCHLRQMYNPVPGAPHNFGGNVDPNMVLRDDWGQWSATTPALQPAPTPTAAPLPVRPPLEEGRMKITDQIVPNQLDTFHVDDAGRLVHHYYRGGAVWQPGEVLAVGCAPDGEVGLLKWAHDGNWHVVAEGPKGGQVHCWWNGSTWGSDIQNAPA